MKLKRFVIAIYCLLFSAALAGEKPKYQVKVEEFLTTLMNGKTNEAYDKILENSVIKENPQQVDVLKKQTALFLDVYGKALGYDLVSKEEYGGSTVKVIYMLKFQKMPVTWVFYFYRPNQEWNLVGIFFNDLLDFNGQKSK